MRKSLLFPAIALAVLLMIPSCSDSPTDDGQNTEQQVAGFIVDEQAYRVPNALVELFDTENLLVASDTTNEDGEFSLSAATPLADLTMHVTHTDFKAFIKSVQTVAEGASPTEITLPLEHRDSACGHLNLLVRTHDNLSPLENVEVRLTRNGSLVTKAYTDANGRLQFNHLIAGKYGLRFAIDGYKVVEKSFTIEHCDSASFDIRMEASGGGSEDSCCDGVLELVVKDENTGHPIVGVLLKMWHNGQIIRDARSGENGVIRLGDICKGTYGFDLIREGYKSKEFSITFGCSEVKGETIKMTPTGGSEDSCCHGILTVTVVDKATKAPLAQAAIKFWHGSTLKETVKTNEHGIAVIDGICKGEAYQISVIREHYKGKEINLEFGCNEQKSVTVELEAAEQDTCCHGVFTLTVYRDGTSDPVPNATVKLWRNGAIVQTGKTNEHGVVVMDGICEGKYGVDVLREGYKAKEFQITFGCNERKSETVYITKNSETCCTASLKLRLIDKTTQNWIAGATVVIKKGESTIWTGTTDVEGWVLKEGLCAPAEYTVVIEKEGYQRKSFNVTYHECKRIQETIHLETN